MERPGAADGGDRAVRGSGFICETAGYQEFEVKLEVDDSVGFEIRNMEKRDIPEIMAIENVSFPAPWAEQAFLGELKNEFAFYCVVIHEGKVAGYCGTWLFSGDAHITTVAVHPDCRGQGLGKMLMHTLIRHARCHEATTMLLEVRPSNLSARNLYKNLGFRQIGCRKNYYIETREDALVMTLDIMLEKGSSGIRKSEW
jgi:ribosomal-protein-alanine N-acetyltransferase